MLRTWLVELVQQVARRLRRHQLLGKTVDIKVRFADFKTITRSTTLSEPTNITSELLTAGIELLTNRMPTKHLPVRLLGFGVTNFDHSDYAQQQLFDQPQREREQELDRVADQIAEKFGHLALRRGSGIEKGKE